MKCEVQRLHAARQDRDIRRRPHRPSGATGAFHHRLRIATRRIDSVERSYAFNHDARLRMLDCLVRETPLQIGIVGGGATGVELTRLARSLEAYGARGLSKRLKIVLIESGSRLLSAYPEDVSVAAREHLEDLGIKVLTGAHVAEADDWADSTPGLKTALLQADCRSNSHRVIAIVQAGGHSVLCRMASKASGHAS